jgi:hypothetical protein
MAIVIERGGSYQPIEEGSYQAVCYGIVNLGTQKNEYQGKVSFSPQVQLLFELVTEYYEADDVEKRRTTNKIYTARFTDKSNLYLHLKSWIGKIVDDPDNFDLETEILGKSCLLGIVNKKKQNGDLKDDIGSIMPLPKGMPIIPAENEPYVFDFKNEDALEILDTLPDWIYNKIIVSPEFLQEFGEAEPKSKERNLERDNRAAQQPRTAATSRRTVGGTAGQSNTQSVGSRRTVTRNTQTEQPRTDVF